MVDVDGTFLPAVVIDDTTTIILGILLQASIAFGRRQYYLTRPLDNNYFFQRRLVGGTCPLRQLLHFSQVQLFLQILFPHSKGKYSSLPRRNTLLEKQSLY